MKIEVQPREVPIYCHGEHAVATFNWVERVWRCQRCGAKVKIAW